MAEKRVEKSEAEWREHLTDQQYHVTRECGTEPAFSGKYHDSKASGTYRCVCCGQDLFRSDAKFDSGTGWPSFFEEIEGSDIEKRTDHSYGMVRVEVRCGRCGAHLGHVFDDGPLPTGKRYCMNSAALDLEADSF